MATKFAKGEEVRLVAVVPQGIIESLRMSEDGVFSYFISWTDVNGNAQQRWFEESQLEAV